jgi:hypothetical protein
MPLDTSSGSSSRELDPAIVNAVSYLLNYAAVHPEWTEQDARKIARSLRYFYPAGLETSGVAALLGLALSMAVDLEGVEVWRSGVKQKGERKPDGAPALHIADLSAILRRQAVPAADRRQRQRAKRKR